MTKTVDFWFDPLCPWAWIASRWVLEAAEVRDLDIEFHLMSLAILNKVDKSEPMWGPVRVVAAAQNEVGQHVVAPLYAALGRQLHDLGEPDWDKAVRTSLAEVGLSPELAEAATSDRYDQVLTSSHETGTRKVGQDVGTPVISVEQTAFFGPVVTPAPRGEAAGKLWDGVLLVAQTPGFYELKRTRDRGPIFT